MNHPRLNAFKQRRLAESIAHLRWRYHDLLANGRQRLVLALNLDNEPVYWASGNAGLGEGPLLADFNEETVRSARRDGVVLDPIDGLHARERFWLWRNLLAYQSRMAGTIADTLRRDASVVTGAGAAPARDLLANNLYTQAMVASPENQYPMFDRAYPFWESAAPARARVGGEWNRDSLPEREAVLHHLALGRSAGTNAEAGNDAEERQGVPVAYALAQHFFALYNYPLDSMNIAAAELRDLSRPFPATVYRPVLREYRIKGRDWHRQVVVCGGLQSGYIPHTAVYAVYPASAQEPGYLTFRLDALEGGFATGVVVEWSGRAFVHRKKDAGVCIRVFVGDTADPAAMREAGRVFDSEDLNRVHETDLGDAARGKRALFVRFDSNCTPRTCRRAF